MTKTILCADDSATMQKVAQITFSVGGFRYVGARSVDEAIKLARAEKPALILADALLGAQSGYDLCQAIKADGSLAGTQVLILCGNSQPFDAARGQAAGADGHVVKPWDSQTMLDKVTQLLGGEAARPAAAPAVQGGPQMPQAQRPGTVPAAAQPRPGSAPMVGNPAAMSSGGMARPGTSPASAQAKANQPPRAATIMGMPAVNIPPSYARPPTQGGAGQVPEDHGATVRPGPAVSMPEMPAGPASRAPLVSRPAPGHQAAGHQAAAGNVPAPRLGTNSPVAQAPAEVHRAETVGTAPNQGGTAATSPAPGNSAGAGATSRRPNDTGAPQRPPMLRGGLGLKRPGLVGVGAAGGANSGARPMPQPAVAAAKPAAVATKPMSGPASNDTAQDLAPPAPQPRASQPTPVAAKSSADLDLELGAPGTTEALYKRPSASASAPQPMPKPAVAAPVVSPAPVVAPAPTPVVAPTPAVAPASVATAPAAVAMDKANISISKAAREVAVANGLAADGPEMQALVRLSREVIEKVAWEIVPELAEAMLRENLDKLVAARR